MYDRPDETASAGTLTTTEAPGARWPTRTDLERVTEPPLRPLEASGMTEAAAQMSESGALPAFATTRTTETRSVGGSTEVEPGGGSCIVVEVGDVGVVVVVEVDVVVVLVPGSVVDVVVDVVVVVVVVVGGRVVVVGSPLIRTTGG